jgi:hypothetical protein
VELVAVPQDGERIAADTIAGRFYNRERDCSGDYRVRGVTALYNMLNPACAASGCDVATALRASIGIRCEG